jgi:acyl-CoA synthetase (AMP-forming)/AMP-acid ligase II
MTEGDLGLISSLALPAQASGLTMGRFLADVCARDPVAAAINHNGVSYTYAELEASARAVAKALLAAGSSRGTPVAALLTNRPEWVATAFAVGMIGGLFIPVNTFATADERTHILQHSEAALLLIQPTASGRPHLEELIGQHSEFGNRGPNWSADLPRLRRLVCLGEPVGDIGTWDEFLDEGSKVPDQVLDAACSLPQPQDDAVVIYTSGTTSTPKAVLHMQQAPVIQFWRWAEITQLTATDRVWSLQPFFWTAGFAWALGATLAAGACLVIEDTFDPHRALTTIARERVTVVQAAATIEARLAEHAIEHPGHDLHRVRSLRPWSPLRRVLPAVSKPAFGGMYGATEAFTLITVQLDSEVVGHGRPLPGMEVRILDSTTGRQLQPGELGQIAVRGPSVMRAYYKSPLGTSFDRDGFFVTDDVGFIDGDGALHFEGRSAGVIRSAGVNVSTLEVELALRAWGKVRAAAVVGVPHPTLGEAVVACVVRDSIHIDVDEAAVREAAAASLTSYKVPRRVLFVDEASFPLTATGKGRISELKRMAIDQLRSDPDPGWREFLEELSADVG